MAPKIKCDTCGQEAAWECQNLDGAHDGDREIFACASCSWENHASCKMIPVSTQGAEG